MRLNCRLTSYPHCDEFQVDRMLVFVSYDQAKDRRTQLLMAETRLPLLECEIPKVVHLLTAQVGSQVSATVIGIRIEPDGTASYDCTFFDVEFEDRFFYVFRAPPFMDTSNDRKNITRHGRFRMNFENCVKNTRLKLSNDTHGTDVERSALQAFGVF